MSLFCNQIRIYMTNVCCTARYKLLETIFLNRKVAQWLYNDLRSTSSDKLTLKAPMIIIPDEGFSYKVAQMATKRDDNVTLGDLYISITVIKSGRLTVSIIVISIK